MCWPSTGMSMASALGSIRPHDGVLGDGPELVIIAAEMHDGARRHSRVPAVGLAAPGAAGSQSGVRGKRRRRRAPGPAGAAAPPRLLKHAAAAAPAGVEAGYHVVVPP